MSLQGSSSTSPSSPELVSGVERGKKHKLMDMLFIGLATSRARKDNAATNLATVRRIAIIPDQVRGKRVKGKSSIRGSFKNAGWNTAFLERILVCPE
jgi:hypothetical protein